MTTKSSTIFFLDSCQPKILFNGLSTLSLSRSCISPPYSCLQINAHLQTHSPDPRLVINGPCNLYGHVSISGFKNSAFPILAATLCCSGTSLLNNVPDSSDIRAMLSVLGSLGAHIEVKNHQVLVNSDGVRSVEPCSDEIRDIRGGFFGIGLLLARFGEAAVTLPCGCNILSCPVDIDMRGLL